jgi:hypothetical protein
MTVTHIPNLQDRLCAGADCPCDICSGLKRERQCREWLENHFQKPFPKTRPGWLINHTGRHLELDGYCEELKIAFEHQGEQHYIPHRFSSSQTKKQMLENLTDQKLRDVCKAKLCQQHGVCLIVISYLVNIEEFLTNLFNPSWLAL